MEQLIDSVSIVGAGLMGRGIAAINVDRGIPVTITDTCTQALEETVRFLDARVGNRAEGTRANSGDRRTALIRVAADVSELAESDLIIETVSEKLRVKRSLFSDLGPHLHRNTIVCTNTSSIPLSQIASRLPHRTQFCGLHFCHPVDRRPLVEVVCGDDASSETIASAIRYAKRLDKSPVVVRDQPGFVVNRLLVPYLNEALELILEGAAVADVEEAAVSFGMPIGPLHQLDEFGIDVSLQTGLTLYKAFSDRVLTSPLLIAMYEAGRFGTKAGGGFFDTGDGTRSKTQLTRASHELIEQHRRCHRSFTPEEITRRLFLPMLLEGTRILAEKVVSRAEDVDSALRDGLDFRPSSGGLLRWADNVGAHTILNWLAPLQELGARFQPTQWFIGLANQNDQMLEAA